MKFLICLVLIILSINNFYICNGEPIISLKTFQYDQYGCRGDSGSSLGPMSTGSFNAVEEKQLGNIDGGNSQSASWSSSIATCDNIELEYEMFIALGKCAKYDENSYTYFIFRIDYENGTISKTHYNESSCSTPTGTIEYYKMDECVNNCKISGPFLYTIIESTEIEIPKNTLVEFDYTGDCGDGWKENYTTIKYTPINRCLLTSENTAYQVTCNSTNFNIYNSVDQNNCIRYHSEFSTKTGVQYCRNTNEIIFCNI